MLSGMMSSYETIFLKPPVSPNHRLLSSAWFSLHMHGCLATHIGKFLHRDRTVGFKDPESKDVYNSSQLYLS